MDMRVVYSSSYGEAKKDLNMSSSTMRSRLVFWLPVRGCSEVIENIGLGFEKSQNVSLEQGSPTRTENNTTVENVTNYRIWWAARRAHILLLTVLMAPSDSDLIGGWMVGLPVDGERLNERYYMQQLLSLFFRN